MKATKRLIDSVWTLDFTLNPERDGEVIINEYSRDDAEGYLRERELPKMRLMENDKRIVYGAKIGDTSYIVSNPKHIFSYK